MLCGVVLLGIVQVTTEFLAVALNVPRLVLNNLNKEQEYSMAVIGNEWAYLFLLMSPVKTKVSTLRVSVRASCESAAPLQPRTGSSSSSNAILSA